ncbi:MAG: hypothetical protein HY289_15655 [Planctomycetes bacterium]|nr:hypothetical protein [Planctomycetota bacterium]
MRRLMLLLVAVGFLGSLGGCKLIQAHGVCDCDDDNHCQNRAPWVQHGVPIVPATELVPVPTKEGKKL